MTLNKHIRDIPNFPKKGILFKDITPLLKNKKAFSKVIDLFNERHKKNKIDKIVGIEARGFIFGASLAIRMGCGFVPIRKPNKLPYQKYSYEYTLEYGKDKLEVHKDALNSGENILLIDDVLATGGTACAAIKLIEKFNCNLIECLFVLEISGLKGEKRVLNKNKSLFSLIKSN